MTNKLVTAYVDDNGEEFRSLEEAVTYYDSMYVVEGIRRNVGTDPNGLYVGSGFGFDDELAQIRIFTVEYTVSEEYAISLVEEQGNVGTGLGYEDSSEGAGGDGWGPTESDEGGSGVDELPPSAEAPDPETGTTNPEEPKLEKEQDNGNSELEDGAIT